MLLIALVGLQYGAFLLYATPVVICIIQFFRPTMLGWLLVFIPCAAMSVAWLFGLIRDLIKISKNSKPSILLDFDDSLVFLITLAVFIGLCYWLWHVRPKEKITA
jgi:hypothetical protein